MTEYVCAVCGYTYDPAKGDPDNGIAPGTPFENLPDDYVCPVCGGITMTTGQGTLSCCGRTLEALTPRKAAEEEKLSVERMEDEWYVTSSHPMTKDHHIAFLAFAAGDRVQIIRQYPEWDLSVRIPARGRGTLLWYCTQHGLFYQYL